MKVLLALILVSTAFAGEKDLPAYRPPVADEAHGLKGAEREVALHVYGSHYGNLLAAFDPIRLPGRDLKDFSKPAVCEVKVSIDPKDFRPGSFVDGLPVRRAQPIVFNGIQQQLVEGQLACQGKILLTAETWREMESKSLELLVRNSGTTYCRADSDCYGAEIVADPCGTRRKLRVFGSNTTDAVFFIAWRKFMPPLLGNLQQAINGDIGRYAERHPDHGISWTTGACPMKHWEETPIDAVCVEHSCRARD
jgi:hypothetical protein